MANRVASFTHDEERRKNIPTAEYQSMVEEETRSPLRIAYERRNRDLDPQLVWRGKDDQDWSDLVVNAPPLYIQEKIHPKALVDDLINGSRRSEPEAERQLDLFGDFNGIPESVDRTEFYRHDQNWSNRMILGDSLQVMASLAEREGLRGKVQCIYIDPPYGIKFNSNFQWSTTSRDVKDGKTEHITREPEQVKAFRDTWRDGIHSYLTYLRDRLTVARELLTDSGSIFVQIGDENVHRVRALMDEVFGEENYVSIIAYAKTTGFSGRTLSNITDNIIWYARCYENIKYRALFTFKTAGDEGAARYRPIESIRALSNSSLARDILVTSSDLTSQGSSPNSEQSFACFGKNWMPPHGLHWKTTVEGLQNLYRAGRIIEEGNSLRYVRMLVDFAVGPMSNVWMDIGGVQSRTDPKVYVVQTATEAVKRCILMTTDPGDLVLDPTCGSGTTAYVAEQWGRRWITIDTSRVALALARARLMGARYPYYLLADSEEGKLKEAEVARTAPSERPVYGDIRQGFVYERVPHITLKSIANNSEIDVICEKWQEVLEPLRVRLNEALDVRWEEWEVPRVESPDWSEEILALHREWWKGRIERQGEIDGSIAAKADFEYLYDRPYEDRKTVRVAGPFTVESASPYRTLTVDENDEFVDPANRRNPEDSVGKDFAQVVMENLRMAGVQQAHKEDRIVFSSLKPWPGRYVCGEGLYSEGEDSGAERRAAVFIGPEFGTVSRPDLVEAAREAADAGFDVLVACAFSFEAHTTEFNRLGSVLVLKARMNAELHMGDSLKSTGKGNLFVIFGEPDIELLSEPDGTLRVRIRGVDVFHPQTGEIRSDGPEGIACWFVDTDYDEDSFCVRHAYFLGANDPYDSLKRTLKAEIDEEAWESLRSDVSRPFKKPRSGRVAVKVINHLGDEVMKVYRV